MNTILTFARLTLTLTFLVSGIAKFADRPGARQAIDDFGIPKPFVTPLSLLLPFLEILVAELLIPASLAWWGALGAFLLLLAFTVGISLNLLLGKHPHCHCFGKLHSAPIGWTTLLRNAFLTALAVLILVEGRAYNAPDSLSAFLSLSGTTARAIVELSLSRSVIAMLILQAMTIVGVGTVIAYLFKQERKVPVPMELVALRPHG